MNMPAVLLVYALMIIFTGDCGCFSIFAAVFAGMAVEALS